jgi:recombination protein RecR
MNCGIELLESLVEKFKCFQGIGEKAAWKMVFQLLNMPESAVIDFANKLMNVVHNIKKCKVCGCFTESNVCYICGDDARDKSVVCVVQSMKDLLAFERTNNYKGVYHVLGGLLSPLDDVGPDDIGIEKLFERVNAGGIAEVIMATGPTVEGEATTSYISRLLMPMGVKVTRLAYGLPIGANLEYIDDITLNAALNGRREL